MSDPVASPPIERSDIRRWAIAVYWPQTPPRMFWDEVHARDTRWGGIIALREFNPFAWPVPRPAHAAPRPARLEAGQRLLNGGQTEVYAEPMRPGDVISSTSALVRLELKTIKAGPALIRVAEMRWTNAHGQPVKTRTSVHIQY